MTCRERLKIEHPECVGAGFTGGCRGCPDEYGYAASYDCAGIDCRECWNREVEVLGTVFPIIKNLFEELENTVMHPNWGSDAQKREHFEELKKKYVGEMYENT